MHSAQEMQQATLSTSSCPVGASHVRRGLQCAQDVRTWEVVWRGDAGCPVLGCCFLPSAPDVLAVCCPEDHIRLFDTSAAEPAPAVERGGIGSLWGSAAKPRQLLCVAAASDGSALAASGTVT